MDRMRPSSAVSAFTIAVVHSAKMLRLTDTRLARMTGRLQRLAENQYLLRLTLRSPEIERKVARREPGRS